MSGLLQDLRYAVRVLLKNRGFSATAILTLALGIGVNTSIFSIADGILFRPLPYPHPDRLVSVLEQSAKGQTFGTMRRATFDALLTGSRSFEALGVIDTDFIDTLVGADQPVRLRADAVSPQLLRALGVEPVLGHAFGADDYHGGGERPALLMHPLWRAVGGDRDVIGKTWRLEDRTLRIVGVMPADFIVPADQGNPQPDVLVPLVDDPAAPPASGARVVPPIGRLKDGVTIAQAEAEARAMVRAMALGEGHSADGMTVRIVSLRENLFYVAQPVLFVLVGAAAFVLLIVCANLASLLLARGSERERELAIRTALGASRGRLARQLMLESLLIAVIGGGCGLLLANATFDLIYALVPGRVYRIIPAGIDYRVVVFATLSSLCAGLLFGVAPAQRLSKPDILPSLQQGKGLSRFGAGSWQTGTLLVASETALVVVLLAGAGLMVNSFARLLRVDLGVNPDRVDILTVSLPRTRYPRLAAFQFDQQLLERVSALPDVDRAAGAVSAPLFGSLWMRLSLPDSPTASGTAEPVTAGYFRTFGIRLLAGRAFTDHEAMTNAPVAVLSESAARIGWPRGDALGSTFQNPRDQPRQIIGIVADIRQSVRQRAVPVMYMPFDAATFRSMTIAVRSREDPRAMAAMLKAQVRSLDPNLMATVSPFTEILDAQIAVPRFQTLLFSVFAVLGLILAAIGIFGVVGYTVARRTHEIGVRMALGADARDVMRMVIREALTPVAAGLGIGLIGAFWITRLLASWLFEVTPHDPATLTAVSLLLVGTALAATYFPARRASRVDPMEALRTE